LRIFDETKEKEDEEKTHNESLYLKTSFILLIIYFTTIEILKEIWSSIKNA